MLLRVRSKNGIWRIPDLNASSSTVRDIKRWIEKEHAIPMQNQILCLDQRGENILKNDQQTLKSLHLGHGDMIYMEYDGALISTNGTVCTGRKITADGTLTHVTYHDRVDKNSFRPGLKALRDMKMHWTIGEFMRMDAQFEFKISAQKAAHCSKLILDQTSCQDFQSYLRQFAFQQSRCGWLYGSIDEETKEIKADFIYEPPQEGDPFGFEVFDDPNADKVDQIAQALNVEKVGWVFSHPPREDETFHFSSREILLAAQLQLDAGGKGCPFVTLKVTLDKEGQASFEAFQVSDQCLEMFSAGALVESTNNPQVMQVHETFTALVEAKEAKEVDNNFFLCVVPVTTHDSGMKNNFPKLNREGSMRTRQALKEHLQKYNQEPYVERLKDFQLLIFLADFLDLQTDIPAICQSIQHPKEIPLDSGYPILTPLRVISN
jgi:nuclear protein localization family protein 4